MYDVDFSHGKDMRFKIKFVLILFVLIPFVTAHPKTAIQQKYFDVAQAAIDLPYKSIERITDDDLYDAMDLLDKPDKNEQTFKYIKRVLDELVKRSNLQAEYALGIWYEDELNPEYNIQKSIYWYTKAAEHGVKDAQNDLGFLYFGERGFPKNLDKAEYWLLKAVEGNKNDSDPMMNLGVLYFHEITLPAYEKSIYWFDRAARLGDVEAYLLYVEIQVMNLLPKVNYELGYYRASILKRYQNEVPEGWAELLNRHPEAKNTLYGSTLMLLRGMEAQQVRKIDKQVKSTDLSKLLRPLRKDR